MDYLKLKKIQILGLYIITGLSLIGTFIVTIVLYIDVSERQRQYESQVKFVDMKTLQILKINKSVATESVEFAKTFTINFMSYLFNFQDNHNVNVNTMKTGRKFGGISVENYYNHLILNGSLRELEANNIVQGVSSTFYHYYNNWTDKKNIVDNGDYYNINVVVPVLVVYPTIKDNNNSQDRVLLYNVKFKAMKTVVTQYSYYVKDISVKVMKRFSLNDYKIYFKNNIE